MPKMPRTGATAQQAVNGGDIAGDFLPNLVVHFQRFNLQADGLGQARSRFARGRCQADSQGSARFNRRGLEQRQQTHHGGGFAGTRAARDDAEGTACGQRTGQFLPVNRRIALRSTEKPVQPRRQIGRRGFGR